MRFKYTKKDKLKSKKVIDQLFTEGKSVSVYPLKLVYLKTKYEDNSIIKTSVSVSKRLHKTAVARNRIKRLLREAYRLNKPLFFNNSTTSYAFMILYLSKDGTTFEELNTKMKLLFEKFLHKKLFVPVITLTLFISSTAFKTDFFEIAKQIEIFTTLFKELNMNYVDDTNPGDLMDTAIKSMLDDLDPYTQFYNEQDVEASRINNAGDYTGIGARVLTLKDKLVIVEPYKNYAADKAGLKAGDEIIKVDNVTVADFKDDAANLLQGAAGTEVTITYKRQGKTNSAKIIRESLEIKAVPHYSMIDDKTGYIVLKKFNDKASAETLGALRALKNQGATQLILDLRGNPGGLLNEAVNVTNIFVPILDLS